MMRCLLTFLIFVLFGTAAQSQSRAGYEYLLLATNKTSTMQKELNEAGKSGFIFCGITVAETSFGGKEVVSIMRRPRRRAA
jgi:hypothetical protein